MYQFNIFTKFQLKSNALYLITSYGQFQSHLLLSKWNRLMFQ